MGGLGLSRLRRLLPQGAPPARLDRRRSSSASYRFLETSAPRVIERARDIEPKTSRRRSRRFPPSSSCRRRPSAAPPTPRRSRRSSASRSRRASRRRCSLKQVQGRRVPRDRRASARRSCARNIAQAARKLSSLIAEEGSPVDKKLAIRVEETGRRAARVDRELTPYRCARRACAPDLPQRRGGAEHAESEFSKRRRARGERRPARLLRNRVLCALRLFAAPLEHALLPPRSPLLRVSAVIRVFGRASTGAVDI